MTEKWRVAIQNGAGPMGVVGDIADFSLFIYLLTYLFCRLLAIRAGAVRYLAGARRHYVYVVDNAHVHGVNGSLRGHTRSDQGLVISYSIIICLLPT